MAPEGGGGPQYDVTVYCLHNLTGILGSAERVTALSGMAIPEREFRGKKIRCEMDDTTLMLIDFGSNVFAFVYATVGGSVTGAFQPNIYGTRGAVTGTRLGGKDLKLPEGCLVAMVRREGRVVIPRGSTEVEDKDLLTIIGEPEAMQQIYRDYFG